MTAWHEPMSYVIYLEADDDVPGGYLCPHNGINDLIYGRGSLQDAQIFNKPDGLEELAEIQDLGYEARLCAIKLTIED